VVPPTTTVGTRNSCAKQLRKTQRRIMLVATLCDRKLLPWTTGVEENRANRRLLLAALERIPAIEAPAQEPPGETVEAAEEAPRRSDQGGGHEPSGRPWWRRLFGG
jgi:hypothetical protein